MNIYITAAVKELKEKLNAYLSLLSYRYANLCVKAELGALLPVTVAAERDYNLEDVAKLTTPDDFHFEIYPNVPDHLHYIIEGVLDVHPEFKMELVREDYGNHNQHIVYTMPEVDKDRRKLLTDTAKVFYEECKAEIEKECAVYNWRVSCLSRILPRLPGYSSAVGRRLFRTVMNFIRRNSPRSTMPTRTTWPIMLRTISLLEASTSPSP